MAGDGGLLMLLQGVKVNMVCVITSVKNSWVYGAQWKFISLSHSSRTLSLPLLLPRSDDGLL